MLKISQFFFISLLFFQTTFSYHYEIKELDTSNLEQVEQVRQLFANSPIQSDFQPNLQDLEKWITQNRRNFLIAVDKKGLISGVAIYFISAHQQLWLETMVISSAHQHQGIAVNLLKQLELIPGKINIGTTITKKIIAFYKLFKKLGYTQTGQFLNMSKLINQSSTRDNKISNFTIRPLNSDNQQEIEQFAKLFDVNEVGVAWTAEEMQDFTTYKNYKFLTAFDSNNQLCGGLIYHILTEDWEIYSLSVHKNFRRCGIATEMIKYLEELAMQSGIEKLTLSVLPTNYAAIACYKKAGFIEKETIYRMAKEMEEKLMAEEK